MTCRDRDQDLLLLIHGELPTLRRMQTQAHLRRCPHCRERQAQFAAVSGLLAGGIRGHRTTPWLPPIWLPHPILPLKWLLLASVILLLAVTSLVVLVTRSQPPAARPVAGLHRVLPPDAGCRPDLPNDRCR